MQSGNPMECRVDAAGQLNSMLDPLEEMTRPSRKLESLSSSWFAASRRAVWPAAGLAK
jgi:hypothetical protein